MFGFAFCRLLGIDFITKPRFCLKQTVLVFPLDTILVTLMVWWVGFVLLSLFGSGGSTLFFKKKSKVSSSSFVNKKK